MRLRVAIRISTAYPEMAKENAEAATSHEAGLIEANNDNAMMDCGSQTNPYQLAAVSWGDLRVNANIVDYMNGYSDPRMSKYFNQVIPYRPLQVLPNYWYSALLRQHSCVRKAS